MTKHLIKLNNRWQLVITDETHLFLPEILHQSKAKIVANQIGKNILHSTTFTYDYFGGTSKVYDYNPYSRQWVLASYSVS